MRNYDKYRDTKFLQKSDLEKPALVTIQKITEEDISGGNEPEKIKYIIHFEENFKPWVPNIGSLEEIHSIAGTGDVDRWPGTKIVLYVNPDVEFAGKRVGGIRCRAPKAESSKQQQVNESQVDGNVQTEEEDDLPF